MIEQDGEQTALERLRAFAGDLRPRRFGDTSGPAFYVIRVPGLGSKALLRSSHGGMLDATRELASLWGCEYHARTGLAQLPTGLDAMNLMAIHVGDALHERPDRSLLPCVRFEEVTSG